MEQTIALNTLLEVKYGDLMPGASFKSGPWHFTISEITQSTLDNIEKTSKMYFESLKARLIPEVANDLKEPVGPVREVMEDGSSLIYWYVEMANTLYPFRNVKQENGKDVF